MKVDRRESLRKFGAFLADSPLAQAEPAGSALAQGEPGGGAPPSDRLAPVLELLNVPEFEAMARLVLPPARFEEIGGGHRTSFDRMTFRQRLMVYAMDLDLTTRLFGYDMFAPIIVGPVANQGDIHPEGEIATARGASAGKAVMVATRQSSQPIDQVVAASDEPVWYQLYADSGALRDDAAQAVDAGCRAVCLTVGVSSDHRPTATDWNAVAALAQAVDVPVVVKGVMSVVAAESALGAGAQGLVVSNHGGLVDRGSRYPGDRRAAGGGGRSRGARAGARRRQLPARNGRSQGARARRRRSHGGQAAHVGPCGLRRRGGAGRRRDPADRAGPQHGRLGPPDDRDDRPRAGAGRLAVGAADSSPQLENMAEVQAAARPPGCVTIRSCRLWRERSGLAIRISWASSSSTSRRAQPRTPLLLVHNGRVASRAVRPGRTG